MAKKVKIEVLSFPKISTLTDFDPLRKDPGADFRYVNDNQKIQDPDLLIIPGSKDTIRDLVYIKRSGHADAIRKLAKKGTMIMGLCGGFQMLGTKLIDVKGSENFLSKCDGLGFFNIVTRFMPSMVDCKTEAVPLKGFFLSSKLELKGFETHTGRTKYLEGSKPAFKITKRDETEVEIDDGAINEKGNIFGTYLHGIFDNDYFRKKLITYLQNRHSRPPLSRRVNSSGNP